jgi:zinc/manganese transport system substrate-binding protein
VAKIPPDRRKVISTHDAFGYFSAEYGIRFIAPLGVSTETEPSARDIAAFENDLKDRKVKLLIYNSQVSEKLTERLRDLAKRAKVPVIGVTETMPANVKFQDWLLGELDTLDKALSGPNS